MTLGPWGQREPMEMYCFLSWEWWGLCLCPRNFAFSPRLINSHSPMWKSNSRSDSVLCSWGFNPASEFRIQLSLNHLELCLPRSLSLSAYYLAVILSALICSRRKHLWWSPNKALMYEYSRVSLGFILLLLFFLKTSIYQWCLEYLVSSSWSRNLCLVSVPSHRVNFVFGWLLLQLFCHYYHYKSKIFVAGLVSVSLLGAYWVPSQTNDTRT